MRYGRLNDSSLQVHVTVHQQLLELEKMKARYLKRVLGVSQPTRSRLVYELAKETFFVEDLKTSLMLPTTTAYKDAL